ncbi:MAG: 50S ribosomal protein L11 methyltransferase [Proteobacteria bacterium]|nr:50S ribosomal protein L11 methyltransferase [Pseudomonadota bacterium]
MSWLQFTIALETHETEAFEAVFVSHGAVALTYESQAQEVVLEPAPGELPMWQQINLLALFSLDTPIDGLNAALRKLDPSIHERLDVAFIAEEDWQQRLANHVVRAEFGQRLRLLPKSELGAAAADTMPAGKIAMYLEPGLAFGSGSHPTTRLCLEWLARNIRPNQRVLDFGCGSGILAIAAALLGATVVAVDHDEQAVLASRENAEFNAVGQRIETFSLASWELKQPDYDQHFDVVVANILALPIIDLAPSFCRYLAPQGDLALSGILTHQAQQVAEAYEGAIAFASTTTEAEWVCLTGKLK